MRALLRKELRELAPAWVLLLVFLLPDLWQGSRNAAFLMPSDVSPLAIFTRALLVGAVIGYVQLRRELWRGTLSSLVHRDTGVGGALAAKACAGIGVAYGIVALPVVGAAVLTGILEPLFFEPGPAAKLCLVASAVVPAYGVGALGATWRGRVSTRLLATGSGLYALLLTRRSVLGRGWEGTDDLRLYVVGALLIGASLFALAGWRIERSGDAERRAGPRETALRTVAAAGMLLAPVWFVCWSLRPAFFISSMGGQMSLNDPFWVPLEGWPRAGTSRGWLMALDRRAGVVHAFDLRGVKWRLEEPRELFREESPQHFRLQPQDAPFGPDVEVLPHGELHDPRTGVAWQVVGMETPRLEGRSSASGELFAGSTTHDPRTFIRVRNPGLHAYAFDVIDPSSGKVLYAYRYRPEGRIAWALLHTFAFFQGPLAATLSFASRAEPAHVLTRPFAEPLLVGGQRPWLLVGTYALFLLLSGLAARHVLLTGGSRTRAACWALGLFVVGPLLYAVFQLVEPRCAYWRASGRRASRRQEAALA